MFAKCCCYVKSSKQLIWCRSAHYDLRENHWLLLQRLISRIAVLNVATNLLEYDLYVTIAKVIPLVKGLIIQLSSTEVDILPAIAIFRSIIKIHQKITSNCLFLVKAREHRHLRGYTPVTK